MTPKNVPRRLETPRDATRRLETPPRRDFDANFNGFAAISGTVFGAFCMTYFSSDFLLVLKRFFDVLLKENLMNKPCAIEDFSNASTLTKHRKLRIETHVFNFGVFCE